MRQFANLFAPALLIMLFLISCQEDGEKDAREITPEEAKAKVDAIADDVSEDVIGIVETDGISALKELMNLWGFEEGRIDRQTEKKKVSDLITNLYEKFGNTAARVAESDPASFELLTGVYEWNAELEQFEKKETSDILIIRFPAKDAVENNAEFRLTSLELSEFTDDEGNYLPTTLNADLSVNDAKVVDLKLSVSYSSTGSPETANITLDITPYSFTLEYSDTDSLKSFLEVNLSKDSDLLVAAAINVTFETDQKDAATLVEGYVQYRTIKLAGNLDLIVLDSTATGDPNEYVELALYENDQKLGDIEFVEETHEHETGYVAYVVFADGTKKPLAEITDPIIAEIKEQFN